MLALRINDDIMAGIDDLTKQRRTSRSDLVRQAIIRFLEDAEDLQLAENSKKKSTSIKSLKDIRKELELDN
jgi:RHH-type rel operon transcriptional repressor/antitoxin RelB